MFLSRVITTGSFVFPFALNSLTHRLGKLLKRNCNWILKSTSLEVDPESIYLAPIPVVWKSCFPRLLECSAKLNQNPYEKVKICDVILCPAGIRYSDIEEIKGI